LKAEALPFSPDLAWSEVTIESVSDDEIRIEAKGREYFQTRKLLLLR